MADEGAGDNTYDATTNTYTAAAASTTAGLQKWSFNSSTGEWQLDYVLQGGLDLGTPYPWRPDRRGDQYPTGLNTTDSGTGPAVGAGHRRPARPDRPRSTANGTVSLWASTSTVSGSGDQGADPNKLVEITDKLGATSAEPGGPRAASTPSCQPTYGQVVRGVAFTPGTPLTNGNTTSPGDWGPGD